METFCLACARGATNDYLANLARVLYDNKLCEHADETPLSDVVAINPETYTPKENWSSVHYLDTGSLHENVISELALIIPEVEKLPSRARRKIRRGDVLYSTVRPNQRHYGIMGELPEDTLASTGFAVLRPYGETTISPLVYLALTSESTIESLQQLAETSVSTIPTVRASEFRDISVLIPADEDGTAIVGQIAECFALVNANNDECKRLEEARDALLPKLMSEEIDVSEVELTTPPNNHLSAD